MAEGVDAAGSADAARRAADAQRKAAAAEAARSQELQQTQGQQQQQQALAQQAAAQQSPDVDASVNQADAIGADQHRLDAARAAGTELSLVAREPAMPAATDEKPGAVTDSILAGKEPPKTGLDKAVEDIKRISPTIAGELGPMRSALHNRSLEETRGIIDQQISRVRSGEPLLVPDSKGLKTLPLDDKARAALTSPDKKTRDAAVDTLARAVEDRKEWDRQYGEGSKGSYTNVDGKTQQEHLEQLRKPGATVAEKKESLDALAQLTHLGRSGDAQQALDEAAKTGNGRPSDPALATAWDKLSKTDPASLSQNDLRLANALLDKHPPQGGAAQEPGNAARDLHDKREQFRQALKDADDIHKRAGFSDDSAVIGTGPDASKALIDDVKGRLATASTADAQRATAALDRLQADPATALPKGEADALRSKLEERTKTAQTAEVKAKLDQAFAKVLGSQNGAENIFDSAKNLFGNDAGSDAVRSSLAKLDGARKALDGSAGKKKEFDDAVAGARSSLAAFEKSQASLGTRAVGLVQAAGGLIEAAVGVATSETGVGLLVAAHGVDQAQAGLRQAITGEHTPTVTQQVLSQGLQVAGVEKGTADFVATLGDAGLSLAGPVAAAKIAAARAARLATVHPVASDPVPPKLEVKPELKPELKPRVEPAPVAAAEVSIDGKALTNNPTRRLAGKPDAQLKKGLTKDQSDAVIKKTELDRQRLSKELGREIPPDPPRTVRGGFTTSDPAKSEKLAAHQLMHSAGADNVVVGENNVRAALGQSLDQSSKVKSTDLLRREKDGSLTPIEVKNETTASIDHALAKFKAIEEGASKAREVKNYEVIIGEGTKLPPNYRTDSAGRLYRGAEGKWVPADVAGKPVTIRRAYLGEVGT